MQTILHYLKPFPIRLGITLTYTITLFVILVQPAAQPVIPTGIPLAPPSIERELFFSTLHIIGFGLLTTLWFWAFDAILPTTQAIISAALIALAIGFLTEYLQTLVPDRGFQVIDLGANMIGISIAAWVIRRLKHR